MKTIKFLHISDLHRGAPKPAWGDEPVGDYKDTTVSKSFAGTITASSETDMISAIQKWQSSRGKIDAIICTGDLGDKGKSDKINEGVSFINMIQRSLGIDDNHVLICPGNHDADRSKTDEHVFTNYSDALSAYNYIDHQNDSSPFIINGIPFFVINTCLGASEKSLFVKKYKELVKSLDSDEQKMFSEELKNEGVEYLDDCFDIPVVTNAQTDRVITGISKEKAPFVVIIMHHSLVPCNSVEIRPYGSVLDAGRVLEQLMRTEKAFLLLHGHVHFPSSRVLYTPQSYGFISSVGAGIFDGATGSSVNILEVFCTDDGDHIITVVYEYRKQVNGLIFNKSFCINHRNSKDCLTDVIKQFDQMPESGIQFRQLRETASCTENDLLRVIFAHESLFKVTRNQSNNVDDWIIHRT